MSKNYIFRKYENNNKTIDGPYVQALVGEIIDRKTNKVVLIILRCFPESMVPVQTCSLMNEYFDKETNQHFGIVLINDRFYKEVYLKEPAITRAIIYHELGHFIHGDLKRMTIFYSEKRKKAISESKVTAEELKADYFASKEVGVRQVIKSLEFQKSFRNSCINDKNYNLAIKEFDLRIAELKKLMDEGVI